MTIIGTKRTVNRHRKLQCHLLAFGLAALAANSGLVSSLVWNTQRVAIELLCLNLTF